MTIATKAEERSTCMIQMSFKNQYSNIRDSLAQSGIRVKIHSWCTIYCVFLKSANPLDLPQKSTISSYLHM